MGQLDGSLSDPFGISRVRQIAQYMPGISAIGVVDPRFINEEHLQKCEADLQSKLIVGMKAYLGYLHFGPDSPSYKPYYQLAAQYQVPFIFHTGDTYSYSAKVKYAHPLRVDEVAVDYPNVNFVIAHFGNPWLSDAAEVVYKNRNVWIDLSGLLVGNQEYFQGIENSGLMERVIERLRQPLEYTEKPERFIFGSDWPLAPMSCYQEFIKKLIPQEYWSLVFEENAKNLFKLEG